MMEVKGEKKPDKAIFLKNKE